MTKNPHQIDQQAAEHQKGNPPKYTNALDRISRRERRNPFRTKYRNDRKPIGTGFLNMGIAWDGRAIFFPKRKKLKGWQRSVRLKKTA